MAAAPTQTTCCLQLSQNMETCQSNANKDAIAESMSTYSFTHAWAHRHRQTVHTFSPFNKSFLIWIVPDNLASHAYVYCLATFVLQGINRIKNAMTHTQTGRMDTVAGV